MICIMVLDFAYCLLVTIIFSIALKVRYDWCCRKYEKVYNPFLQMFYLTFAIQQFQAFGDCQTENKVLKLKVARNGVRIKSKLNLIDLFRRIHWEIFECYELALAFGTRQGRSIHSIWFEFRIEMKILFIFIFVYVVESWNNMRNVNF